MLETTLLVAESFIVAGSTTLAGAITLELLDDVHQAYLSHYGEL